MPDKDDKVFDPTPARIEKAREEGNVFRSTEAISVGLLVTAAVLLFMGMPVMFNALRSLMADLYQNATQTQITIGSVVPILMTAGYRVGIVLLPFMAILTLMSIALSVAQTGWNVTLKPLQPKWEKISPLKGLKRIFSSKGLFELFKALAKIIVAGPMAYLVVQRHLGEILVLHTLPLPTILDAATAWIVSLLVHMLVALTALSIADFAFEKWKYKEDLKMSKKELEEEKKRQEGDPHVKNRRREQAMEMARRPRMDHAVLNSDVVITNPTHYAVALSYDPGEAPAPRVMLKGMRKRALRIRELADRFDVPIVEEPPLARALYANVEEREQIPQELYQAVATILAEIYRQRGSRL
jgi:flagellar biosynthetic protein FlhB